MRKMEKATRSQEIVCRQWWDIFYEVGKKTPHDIEDQIVLREHNPKLDWKDQKTTTLDKIHNHLVLYTYIL